MLVFIRGWAVEWIRVIEVNKHHFRIAFMSLSESLKRFFNGRVRHLFL